MDKYTQIISDLDDDFLASLLEQINEEISVIESQMMRVHDDINLEVQLATVNGSLVNIRSICNVGFLTPLIEYMQTTEKFVAAISSKALELSELLVEVFLLSIDILRTTAEDVVQIRVLDVQLLYDFGECLKKIVSMEPAGLTRLLIETQLTYSTRVRKDIIYNAFEAESCDSPTPRIVCLDETAPSKFKELADCLEIKFPHWGKRNSIALKVCSLMNSTLCEHVDPLQLNAAVYLHDIGMAFLPDKLVLKKGKYNSDEKMLMQSHSKHSYTFLKCFDGYEEAATMVLQHHEWFNGKGYPLGLKYKEIHVGAQLIAISDTYYAMTNLRPDRSYRKSLVRCLSEINKKMGTQFDPKVVDALNAVSGLLPH